MFISIPTNAHRSGINFILKLLQHVSVFLHHPQEAYRFCQLKLLFCMGVKLGRWHCRRKESWGRL